ncbi:MAG: FAD-dependent oxidoreductase, partial [Actinomycetia bacterium]|nr:FAD-dependent oxidoreductase [Actinomycetes bacterium]
MNKTPSSSSRVWTPLTIGTTRVEHRIMMTAHALFYGEDHAISDRHIAYYRERARGGASLLIAEGGAVHPLGKGDYRWALSAVEKRAIPQLARLADTVHEFGTKQFVQLVGLGVHAKGTLLLDEWHPPSGPSRVPSPFHREMPLAMGRDEIREIVAGYGESALNAKVAGLDGVEIHAAHSYLLGQFLSPAYNKRTDAYGCSIRGRCRLALEVAEEVRDRVGDFTVGIRLSFSEFIGGAGITEEEAAEQLAVLADSGLFDFFNISGGGYPAIHMSVASMTVPEGYMIPFGKQAKQIVGDRGKVFIVGRILDLSTVEQVLESEAADMVAMTRAQLADPYLVAKFREGREREIIRCVGANECVAQYPDSPVICVMNPTVGRERQWGYGTLSRVSESEAKKVLVVGGGPAGMKVAEVAARRGHEVSLVERTEELGGHLNLLKRLPTREGWQVAVDNLTQAIANVGVKVELGVDADASSIGAAGAGSVVCATGSTWDCTGLSPYRPDRDGIPGVERGNVLDIEAALEQVLEDPNALGRSVVILDESSTYLPIGLAELLVDAGVDVEVMSPHAVLGEDVMRTYEAGHAFPRVIAKGVRLSPLQMIESIDVAEVQAGSVWGGARRTAAADTVVLSMTRSPN